MKGTILLLTLIALQLLLVSAQPPFVEGYNVDINPKMDYFKEGQDITFNVQITNQSTGFPLNDSITCQFHLYNSSGNHVLVMTQDTPIGYDYRFFVDGGNITRELRSYQVFCYSDAFGGKSSRSMEVTPTGFMMNSSSSLIILGSLFVMIIIGILFFWVATFYNNRLSRITFYTFSSIIFLMTILYTVVIIQQTMYSFEAILTSIDTFWFVISVGVWLGFLALLIVIFFVMLKAWKIKRGYYE